MGQCKAVRLSVRLKMSKKIHIKIRPTGTNKNVIHCSCLCKRSIFDIIKDRTDIPYLNLIHKIIPKNNVNRSFRHEYLSNSRQTYLFLISPIWMSWKFYFCYFEKKNNSELKVCLSHLIQINLNYINYVWH